MVEEGDLASLEEPPPDLNLLLRRVAMWPVSNQADIPTRVRCRVQAMQDELTRLLNLRALRRALASRVSRWNRPFVLLFLDLNRFKEVNDRHGHAAGDQVLVDFARLFREAVGLEGTAYRVGGDEFVALIETEGPAAVAQVQDAMHAARAAYDGPVELPGFSLGWVVFPGEGRDPVKLLRMADERMYACKSRHRGFTSPERDQDSDV